MIAGLMGLSKKYLVGALTRHEEQTGEHYEFVKAGIPPIRLWLKNRKGDHWGKVQASDGSEKWVRLRDRVLTKGGPLTFFDC